MLSFDTEVQTDARLVRPYHSDVSTECGAGQNPNVSSFISASERIVPTSFMKTSEAL